MFDIFGGFKRYENEVGVGEVSDIGKGISAVRYWIFSYTIILILWHGVFSMLFEDFYVTNILLIYIMNPIVWYFLGFTFATDNKRGHNLFIGVCVIIFLLILFCMYLFDILRYRDIWDNNVWAVIIYVVTAKVGTKFAQCH